MLGQSCICIIKRRRVRAKTYRVRGDTVAMHSARTALKAPFSYSGRTTPARSVVRARPNERQFAVVGGGWCMVGRGGLVIYVESSSYTVCTNRQAYCIASCNGSFMVSLASRQSRKRRTEEAYSCSELRASSLFPPILLSVVQCPFYYGRSLVLISVYLVTCPMLHWPEKVCQCF